ncbi:DUF393 domain-containing protein [Vreelandella rituensis]|uniref:DUF393 domain-containing protein n=1 Tax=Vreelandella rituensis TaxID=2282306 RepID=A0A368TYW7_9GAMM|nr:DUF393 domain-containing protein [Halomonas rituensis]RCV89975.1 DUF393 domain-containing protein [Halomonas rituensis]
MTQPTTLYVYYDAKCPGCRRDRQRYERLAGSQAKGIEWVDVTDNEALLRERGVNPQEALLSLHVEDEQGRIYNGLDTYILLMNRAPRLKPLAWLIGLPGIKPVLSWFYQRWVKRRLARQGRLPQ